MKKQPPHHIPVICRQRYEECGPTLQQQFEEEFAKLPEFDFYQTSPGGVPPKGLTSIIAVVDGLGNLVPKHEYENYVSHYDQYRQRLYDIDEADRPIKLFEIKRKFIEVKEEAKAYELKKNFKEAARLYEWLVGQEYPLPFAYDRLIKIYKDHRLLNEAIFTAQEAIEFFTDLKARQTAYVGSLAQKYKVLEYFLDKITEKKKVFYYGGSFELYNPFPIIDKWQIKLEKLCKLKTA